MKITIVANGQIESLDFLKSVLDESDYIICVDGAAQYLVKSNIVPDILIGDLDSISLNDLEWMKSKEVIFHRFHTQKDQTDTELAVEFAVKFRPKLITLVGATGSRLDHSISNIMLLNKLLTLGIKGRIIDQNNEIMVTNCTLHVKGKIGETISIIPISHMAKGVTLEGLEYPLYDKDIPMGSSLGISNRFIDEDAVISLKEGILLVIKARD